MAEDEFSEEPVAEEDFLTREQAEADDTIDVNEQDDAEEGE